ncbi:M48 family metallopeptidase [Cohnella thailandensis]|uniref:M48 family metallopeptidase n=1 Tax=Cohnella thailandensis TaxID=557557 RepID=A0A841T4F6_9BACL|nr:M48 family metallopeptidase [Cohnella thailandensis]MBB6637228.1 M48 family metallopeptidase [Cohnella thailandensis]MBP1976950.1 Zn-dependent protease with chaperone function [Cohnella thailandensis]
MRARSRIGIYALAVIAYAIVMAIYVRYTAPNNVPVAYQGTAADPATFFTSAELSDSQSINAARNWIFFVSGPWEWLIYGLLLFTGLGSGIKRALERRGWAIYVRFPLYVLAISAISYLLYLPLRVFSFAISSHYGITTQPVLSWLRDKAVQFSIGYLTTLAVSAVAFWILSRGGRWWLKLWLLSIPFSLFMLFIQPVVIDPLYNDFTRLSNPELEKHILALADKADIPADRVYEVRMSDKTNSMNAYVNGIGSSLRIVLWDTTLNNLDEKAILLIMAHEMGHYVMHHLEWSVLGTIVSSFFVLWIGGRLYTWIVRKRGESFGISKLSDMNALPLVLLLLSVLSFVSLPISNAISRNAEASADDYAYELIGSSEGAVKMYQQMAVASLSDVNPPLLVRLFRDDHPTDMDRILKAERFAASQGSAGS